MSKIYLNTAATGIVDQNNIQDSIDYLQKITVDPMGRFMEFFNEERNILRERAGALLGTDPDNIAFTANFSASQNEIAASLEGKKKNVLLYRDDYPSLRMPFERRDFHITYIDSTDGFTIDLNELEDIIKKENIEILPISHVQFLSGYAIDIPRLSEICARNNVHCILDITQSCGALPISFSWPGIDVMISSSYKWLRAGHGAALMAVSPEFIEQFPPVGPGFGSMTMSEDGWYYQASAKGYEPGHPNVAILLLLSNALNSAMQYGLESIKSENDTLINYLINGIHASQYDLLGTQDLTDRLHILCVEMPQEVHEQLTQMGFSTTWRKGFMRISPHYYNTLEEIEKFNKALETV